MNRQLAVAAAAVEEAGGSAELLELADYPMPMYDEDEETVFRTCALFKAKVSVPAISFARRNMWFA